jgi:hypothetical protein
MPFWDNILQRLQTIAQPNDLKSWGPRQWKGLHRIAKISQGYLFFVTFYILLFHSIFDPHTALSFHFRPTYCSLIPSSIHILRSHSIFDPHTTLFPSSIHILLFHSSSDPHTALSFRLRSTYCFLIPVPIHILLSPSNLFRSTYCSLIPSSVHILRSHSIFDPHTARCASGITFFKDCKRLHSQMI